MHLLVDSPCGVQVFSFVTQCPVYLYRSIEISAHHLRNSLLFTLLISTYLRSFIRVNIPFSSGSLTLELICTCFIENHINLTYINGTESYLGLSATMYLVFFGTRILERKICAEISTGPQ